MFNVMLCLLIAHNTQYNRIQCHFIREPNGNRHLYQKLLPLLLPYWYFLWHWILVADDGCLLVASCRAMLQKLHTAFG